MQGRARTEVRKGDIWESTDPREAGRQVIVEDPNGAMGRAKCRPAGGGKPTHIARERLERQAGWRLFARAGDRQEAPRP